MSIKTPYGYFPEDSTNHKYWPWVVPFNFVWPIFSDSNPYPLVTIITPSFNQGSYLEETIRSVLLQGYPNLEYIIIDGGSTDNSIDIIRKYEPWITYWISESDNGQSAAINKGFKRSKGLYLGWLNSDDILLPNSIFKVISHFYLYKNVDMIYGNVEQGNLYMNNTILLKGRDITLSESLRTLSVPIPQQGSLWKRSVLQRVGYLDERWLVILDREFFTRILDKCIVMYLPENLGFFRYHAKSKSLSQQIKWTHELPIMYIEFFNRKDLSKNIAGLKRESIAMVFLTCSSIALQCKKYYICLKYLFNALTSDPFIFIKQGFRLKIYYLITRIYTKFFYK